MKRFLVSTLLLAVLGLTNIAFADTKIAVVDVQEVVAKSNQVQALKKEQKSKMEELNKWLKTVRTDVEKQQTTDAKEKLIKKYDAEFVKKQQVIRENYAKKLQAIDKDITATITKEAQAKGYDMVITKGVVLYGGTDITSDVIKAVK